MLFLLGRQGRRLSGATLARATRTSIVAVVVVANLVGAVVVFALAGLILPGIEALDEGRVRLVNAVLGGAYVLFAIVAGLVLGFRYDRRVVVWLRAEREPDETEQRRALRLPLVVFAIHAVLWGVAALLFGGLNVAYSLELALRVLLVVALAGMTTSAIAYLFSERILRPVSARALASRPPAKIAAPGVGVRVLLSWSLGTAVPVLGIVLAGIAHFLYEDAAAGELARTMVALGGVALLVGLLASLLIARTIGSPVRSVRDAVRRVEEGELDFEVRVDDGSELGRLQAGVNQMVTGLREREELRDLFGRHVGEEVARAALDRGVELGGEVREVAVLFVDVVGSTGIAARRPAPEVVELLNRFFGVVVDVVDEHGGWINKFEGDAALAVFGAPAPLEDRDARALAAARVLGARLQEEVPDLSAGVGVAAGEVVAGNIGTTARFEYTVIGDPVNRAARLTEYAKDLDGRVAADSSMLEHAGSEERGRWRECEEVTLRGRKEATRIVAPVPISSEEGSPAATPA
jgi:adenylate cyclase